MKCRFIDSAKNGQPMKNRAATWSSWVERCGVCSVRRMLPKLMSMSRRAMLVYWWCAMLWPWRQDSSSMGITQFHVAERKAWAPSSVS